MIENTQLSFADVSDEYADFVEKFKPKKTTDDCYTPPVVYEAILDWVAKEYGIDRAKVIRPFYPGGDYEREIYPEDCVVVDNPPFSILAQIIRSYMQNGIRFFLFSPYLTCFSSNADCMHVITGSKITYENGAVVDTSFVTNLEEGLARSAPELGEIIKKADAENRKANAKTIPKYSYPPEVVTASMLGYLAAHGVEWRLESGQFIRGLNAQRKCGKALFGGGI